MKYDNYKIENLFFASNEVANWSIEEKREFLETCPENEHLSEAIEEVKRFREADKNGEIAQIIEKHSEVLSMVARVCDVR